MSLAAMLSIVAGALELLIGAIAFAFGRAPGWRHVRLFAWVAFSAAAYSAGDAFFATERGNPELVPWLGRLNLSAALCHCLGWIVYVRAQYAEPQTRFDRFAIRVLGGLSLAAFVPNLMTGPGYTLETVTWAAVTYRSPVATPFGSLIVLLIPVALLHPALIYFRKARARAPGALAHGIGFSILYLTAINETLVVLGVLDNLYLVDVGFLAVVLSVSGEMMFRVAGDARRLQQLSLELSRKVAERTRELGETRDNLVRAERLAALGRLAASVGHEINNPLSYVVGNLEYLTKELESGGNSALLEALRDASSGASRIRRIVHELRVFARGSDNEKRDLVDVRETLEAAVKLVWGELRHRARLETDFTAVPHVLADPTRLTQVFVNLLMNALQAIPEDRIGHPDSLIQLRAAVGPDGAVTVEVRDNGVGIPEQDRPRLFEPFFSTKSRDEGSGLGLFVSLGIVSSLGGSVEVESEPGRGTVVRVLLPAATSAAESRAERVSSLPPPASKRRRLLIIDDDLLVSRTLARLLSAHEVLVANSGREALERLARDQNFDLVLCDLMMPGLTGMDVYERVEREHPALAERFVFISGGGLSDRSRAFIEHHAARVLPKPIEGRQLARLLARHASEPPRRAASDAPVETSELREEQA